MKLKKLKLYDIVIITLILFGRAIYDSTHIFLHTLTNNSNSTDLIQFNNEQNIQGLLNQVPLLVIVIIYLLLRNFDFQQLKFKISFRSTLTAIGLFFGLALVMDVLFITLDSNFRFYVINSEWNIEKAFENVGYHFLNPTLVLYSLLNGVYEEFYFIGICTTVSKKIQAWIFAFSLIIRTSFHTYQGFLPAIGIGMILGFVYYFWYQKKDKNLYPIFLSHSIADILGLSILSYIIF